MSKFSFEFITEFLSVKKNRSRVYTALFILAFILFMIINNIGVDKSQGPYPPDYYELKTSDLKPAADFKLQTIDGNTLTLSDLKGKVVLIDFWATWCPPCKKSIPELIELKKQYKDAPFEIVGVSLDLMSKQTLETVKSFAASSKINYPVVLGNEETVKNYDNVESIPTIFIINKNGQIYSKYTGYTQPRLFIRDIDNLLK